VNPTQKGANEITHGTLPQNLGLMLYFYNQRPTTQIKAQLQTTIARKNLSENRRPTHGLLFSLEFFLEK
jgi:hypothetical protein